MQNGQRKRSGFGPLRNFVPFVVCMTVIGAGAAMHARTLDHILALAKVSFLVVGALVLVWRTWRRRAKKRPDESGDDRPQ